MKKTQTLFHGDTPTISIVKGRLTKRDFYRAWRAEGWGPSDPMDIEYRFARKLKNGWRLSDISDRKAVLVTVTHW